MYLNNRLRFSRLIDFNCSGIDDIALEPNLVITLFAGEVPSKEVFDTLIEGSLVSYNSIKALENVNAKFIGLGNTILAQSQIVPYKVYSISPTERKYALLGKSLPITTSGQAAFLTIAFGSLGSNRTNANILVLSVGEQGSGKDIEVKSTTLEENQNLRLSDISVDVLIGEALW